MKNIMSKSLFTIACAVVLSTASGSIYAQDRCCCIRSTPFYSGVFGPHYYTLSSCCPSRYIVTSTRCGCCTF